MRLYCYQMKKILSQRACSCNVPYLVINNSSTELDVDEDKDEDSERVLKSVASFYMFPTEKNLKKMIHF